jgi:hypothetical protein
LRVDDCSTTRKLPLIGTATQRMRASMDANQDASKIIPRWAGISFYLVFQTCLHLSTNM